MKWFRAIVRSPLMLALGLVGGVAVVALQRSARGFENPLGIWFAAIALALVSLGLLAASLFETRRDRGVIAAIGLALGLSFGALNFVGIVPSDDAQRELREAYEAYYAQVGEPLPAFELRDLDGQVVNTEALRGSTVVLELWKPDGFRLDERMAMRRLADRELGADGLIVLAISDAPEAEQRELAEQLGLPLRMLRVGDPEAAGLRLPPHGEGSVLVDSEGIVRAVDVDGLFGLHRLAREVRGPEWNPALAPVPSELPER